MAEDVKVTVTLPKAIVDKIRNLAKVNHTSLANTVIESINLNEVISASERDRARIIIQRPNGTATELVRDRPDAGSE